MHQVGFGGVWKESLTELSGGQRLPLMFYSKNIFSSFFSFFLLKISKVLIFAQKFFLRQLMN